jgi:hypothetical protein
MSGYQLSLTTESESFDTHKFPGGNLVAGEVFVVAGITSQCPPEWIPCPLRVLRGVRGQGLPGLVDANAVSLLVSAGLL